MNYLKIQQDFLKKYYKQSFEGKGYSGLFHGTMQGLTCIGFDYFIVAIPKDLCKVDLSDVRPFDLKSFDNLLDRSMVIERTESMIANGKYTLNILKNGDEKIYVDTKYLKYFDIKEPTYKGTNRKSPVFIFDHDLLCGFILPVNYKGGD